MATPDDDEATRAPPTVQEGPSPRNSPVRIDDAPLSVGTVLGRYVLLERLGAGGMGVVYAAFDPDLNRRIALKVMRPTPGGSTGGQARMLREAQALARLAHPNVVAIHDVGSVGNQVFLAMELVDGGTLRAWIARNRPPWR